MRVKRLEAVEAYIRQVGSVSIQQLCQEFNVESADIAPMLPIQADYRLRLSDFSFLPDEAPSAMW